ncbi:hypothetical protein, partial [Klebsiella pneumoniae]|uniref:hypothetical protein n=1 Tax=Klebsiella pneumoniae TaxID=573 RepID=UPI001D0F484E
MKKAITLFICLVSLFVLAAGNGPWPQSGIGWLRGRMGNGPVPFNGGGAVVTNFPFVFANTHFRGA